MQLLSRLRENAALFARPTPCPGQAGRPRKYGEHQGSAATLAASLRAQAQKCVVPVYGVEREILAADQVVMLKTLRCPVRVVWVYRQTQWVALVTTALDLSVEQIVEYYAARWKIEIYQTWCLRTDKVTWKKPRSPHRRRHDAVGSRSVAPGVSRASAQARWHRPRSATADGRHARPGVPAGGLCRAS